MYICELVIHSMYKVFLEEKFCFIRIPIIFTLHLKYIILHLYNQVHLTQVLSSIKFKSKDCIGLPRRDYVGLFCTFFFYFQAVPRQSGKSFFQNFAKGSLLCFRKSQGFLGWVSSEIFLDLWLAIMKLVGFFPQVVTKSFGNCNMQKL